LRVDLYSYLYMYLEAARDIGHGSGPTQFARRRDVVVCWWARHKNKYSYYQSTREITSLPTG
jgi:hypothetical protein